PVSERPVWKGQQMQTWLKRQCLGASLFALVATPAILSSQAVRSGQSLDAVIASAKGDVRTGENLKLPPGGDWHGRWKESDFPVVTKVAENIYLYQAPHNFPGWITNSLIIVTTEGVVILDGQSSVKEMERLVGEVKKLTPQPIKFLVVGSTHGDH